MPLVKQQNGTQAIANTQCHIIIMTSGKLTFMGPCIVIIFYYISNKIQHYTVYFIWKLLYMFRVVSSGAQTTVSTASGICQTVIAICRYRGRAGTGLSVLWMAYATHSTLKPVPTLPR